MRYAMSMCTRRADEVDGKEAVCFTGRCIITGKDQQVTVTCEELRAYENGALIQDAMPRLSKGEREFLMSGISDKAFDDMFRFEV